MIDTFICDGKRYEMPLSWMGMIFIIDTFIWDKKDILDTFTYDGEDTEPSLHGI